MQITWLYLTLLGVAAIDEEFAKVTYTSAVKLSSIVSGHRLHSHAVAYGTGSQQQSVTANPSNDDPGSLFQVLQSAHVAGCQRGAPIKCGATIRLYHTSTNKFLHSHLHVSPLSHQQEVSAYFPSDGGDDWIVHCLNNTAVYWMREAAIRLQHVDTKAYLSSSIDHKFSHPIAGQLEVCASRNAGKTEEWMTMEGVFFQNEL